MTTVHLLLHDLDADGAPDEELDTLLDDDERGRAERFVRAVHRRRFRVGRAVLRRTLASWTGRPAASLALEYGRNGKPAMRQGPAFNLSHSEGTLLIGIAEHGRLGVDVEVLRPIDDLQKLATANFARDEVRALEHTAPAEQDEAFLRIWTCKEALIKAVGDGLSIPLQSFTVSPARTGNALEALDGDSFGTDGSESWSVCSVPLVGAQVAAVAAVAIDSRDCEVTWLPGLP